MSRESDLPFRPLPAAALRGRGLLGALRGAATMIGGVVAARQLLDELQPAAILGTGGYVCVPLFLAARSMGVPTLIYLPDVVPGLAVKFLARIATRVACNVEDSLNYFGFWITDFGLGRRSGQKKAGAARTLVTGYPVRSMLFNQDKQSCRQAFGLEGSLPTVLVYGGSLGARSINRAVEALLPDLLACCKLIHICGREGDESWLRAAAERLDPELQARYKLFPYLESGGVRGHNEDRIGRQHSGLPSMAEAFGAADLALCRSGASTLAELPAAGLPAVLVPYPYVHQDENADYLVRRGAAVKVADSAMLGSGDPCNGALFQTVKRLLHDEYERQRMAERSRTLARPDAARRLAEALLGLATRSLS